MANILFVSGSYYPHATANAVCAKKLEDKLREKGHRIIYCNRKHDIYEDDHYFYNDTVLYTVGKNSDLFYQTIQKLQSLELPNKMGICFKAAFSFFRLLYRLINITKNTVQLRDSASDSYICMYVERIQDLIEKHNIDLVISVSMPFSSHAAVKKALAGNLAKKPYWIAYSIDAYWSKAVVAESERPFLKEEERQIFEVCDSILFLDTIENDYKESYYDSYRHKMSSLPLPLFDISSIPRYNEGITVVKGYQNWLFAGTIYDDYSNVESLATLLYSIKEEKIVLHLMGKIYPKSQKVINELSKKLPNRIIVYGKQSYEFAKGSMQKADVLVNLANDNANQIPSKIFEYMSCQKPVLNVYSKFGDVSALYLNLYPLAFNICSTTMESQLGDLRQWCNNVNSKTVTIEQLRNIYHNMLSENVTETFYELVKPVLEKSNE